MCNEWEETFIFIQGRQGQWWKGCLLVSELCSTFQKLVCRIARRRHSPRPAPPSNIAEILPKHRTKLSSLSRSSFFLFSFCEYDNDDGLFASTLLQFLEHIFYHHPFFRCVLVALSCVFAYILENEVAFFRDRTNEGFISLCIKNRICITVLFLFSTFCLLSVFYSVDDDG